MLSQNQISFVKGRYILETVVSTHEISHATMRAKDKGLVVKLDYEKTYDRVSWQFLHDMMESRGFGPRWRD
jgi:hypothetical protein